MGTLGNYDSTTGVVTSNIGTDQWNAFLSTVLNGVQSIAVTAVNIVDQETNVGFHLFSTPSQWSLSTSPKDTWTSYTQCPTGKTLLVVHGMNDFIEDAFSTGSTASTDTIRSILSAGNYQSALGFDYDWTQSLPTSGGQLATFLNTVAQCPGISLDLEAHSEGVPVSMSALNQMNSNGRSNIKRLISLGGPIMGTPIATDGRLLATFLMGQAALNLGSNVVVDGLAALLNRPFVADLEPSKPGDQTQTTLEEIRAQLAPDSRTNSPQIFVAAGDYPHGPVLLAAASLLRANGVDYSDGFIPVASALALQPEVDATNVLKVYPFAPFSADHTDLTSDSSVIASVGVQVSNAFVSPSLTISSSQCSSGLACSSTPDTTFSLEGNGYSANSNQRYRLLESGEADSLSSFTSSDGSIPQNGWQDTPPCSTAPQSVAFFAENLATQQVSNAVTEEVAGNCPPPPASDVSIAPTSVSLGEGGSQIFTATVSGGGGVNWSIQEGSSGGTLVSTGLSEGPPNGTGPSTYTANYFAPNTTGTFHVVATSQADPGASATATVYVSGPVSTVTISPTTVSVPALAVQTFSASVSGGGQINWSIQEGASGGAITNFGIYTAPASYGTFHIVATNAADPTQTAVAVVTAGPGPLITPLHSFNHAVEGANPWSALIQGNDGDFYGTTDAGGDLSCSYLTTLSGCGTVFKMDVTGNVTVLHSFTGTDGIYPGTSLTLAKDGSLYGTTEYGGVNIANCVIGGTSIAAGCGTTFKIDPSGNFSQAYSFSSFSSPEGVSPTAPLILASDGNLYGSTFEGGNALCMGTGSSISTSGCGGIFKIDAAGTLTPLHSFSGSDGAYPASALLEAPGGSFYGATTGGGNLSCSSYTSPGCGSVFKTDSSGNITNLYSFSQQDGAAPDAALIRGTDGSLYGTTLFGGSAPCTGGAPWAGCGTIFKIDTAGKMTVLHSFSSPDGAYPAQLIQASDGFFYGTTESGGDSSCQGRYGPGCGTVFRMDAAGNITVINTFTGESDGSWPESALIQGTDGDLYGTTAYGGTNDDGVVFRISNLNLLNSIKSQTALVRRDRIQVNAIAVKRPHFGLPLAAAPAGRP